MEFIISLCIILSGRKVNLFWIIIKDYKIFVRDNLKAVLRMTVRLD